MKLSSTLGRYLLLARWLLPLALLSLSGCSGCRRDADSVSREELEKAREKKESLEMSELLALPIDAESKVLTAKPGHWYDTQQQIKSNREDLQVLAVGSVQRGKAPAKISGTDFLNEYTRRTALPKGQTKTIDLQYFVPTAAKQESDDLFTGVSTRLQFGTQLFSWPLLTPILQSPNLKPANELKPHEFQLVVLSPRALSYEYLTVTDAVYWKADELAMTSDRTRSYYISLLRPNNNRYALPRSMLTMTAVAVLLWDDVSVDDLSIDQQNAIVDWVHWGGQLIVSGPGSWARLQNSFLSPYLPVQSSAPKELGTESFAQISQKWMVPDVSRPKEQDPLEIVGNPIGGLELQLSPRGQWLPGSGQLVAETKVGRGRIVVTAFPTREPRIFRWKYFSSFLSTGLLRRPPRDILKRGSDGIEFQRWARPYTGAETDARMHSNVRITSRDLSLAREAAARPGPGGSEDDSQPSDDSGSRSNSQFLAPLTKSAVNAEAVLWSGGATSGGAAWNDYSGLSYRAREALRAAAGIELPSRRTIIYLLASYLLCLVPLNWLVFKAIGRLELAWVAAPIMAMIGVAVVTRVAQLDIGFARRTTEIGFLELHGNHSRGHLTQYIALYTSLSDDYAVEFPENGSVALPFGDVSRLQLRAENETRTVRTNYGVSEGVRLEPLTVYSSSTEMVHAEQMVQLPGGFRLGNRESGEVALKNETELSLRGALVVRRLDRGEIEFAWIGELAGSETATLEFETVSDDVWKRWASNPLTQSTLPSDELLEQEDSSVWIGGILHEVVRKTPLMPGQTRLVAYTADRPSQLTVTPKEDQYDGSCVVVAHLTPAKLGPVIPDKRIMSRIASGMIDPAEIPEELITPGREDVKL